MILVDKLIATITEYTLLQISLLGTVVTLSGSVPLVYISSLIFSEEYTFFLAILSISLPILLTPIIVYVIVGISKHLKYFKEELTQQIQKNKEADVLLFEQARFILMGEMMANISHQWKQPLNTIGLSIVNLRTSPEKEEEYYFDIMEDNVRHLASTIDDFISFFDKKTYLELRTLESIVREIKSIVGTTLLNHNIELEILIDETYSDVEIASSISQVVLNLINNSKDALLEKADNKSIRVQFMSNEYGLEIECSDNGKGIIDEQQDKIFDPYFTTKHQSQGTGIGLYMSKEIIQKVFLGKINVNSRTASRSELHPIEYDGRTCFYLAIPYSDNCKRVEGFE